MLVTWSCILLGNLLVTVAEGMIAMAERMVSLSHVLIRWGRNLVQIAAKRVQ